MIEDFFAEEARVTKPRRHKKKRRVGETRSVTPTVQSAEEVPEAPLLHKQLREVPTTTISSEVEPVDDFERELGLEQAQKKPACEPESASGLDSQDDVEIIEPTDDFDRHLQSYQDMVSKGGQTLEERVGSIAKDATTVILVHLSVGSEEFHVKVRADKRVGRVLAKFGREGVIYFPQLRMYLGAADTFYAVAGLREVLQQDMGMLVCRGIVLSEKDAKDAVEAVEAIGANDDDEDGDVSVTAAVTSSEVAAVGAVEANGFPVTLQVSSKLKYKVMVTPATVVSALHAYLAAKTPPGGPSARRARLSFDNEVLDPASTISATELEEDDIIDVSYDP